METPILPDFDAATDTLIDAYLRRELNPDQMKMFEKRLDQDPKLMEEVRLRIDIIIGIKSAERKYIRRILEDPNFATQQQKQSDDANNAKPLTRNPIFWVAVAVGAAGGAFLIYKLMG